MNNTSQEEMPKHQWHFMLVLLPFILGLYLADYRNLTDTSLFFFEYSECAWRWLALAFSNQTNRNLAALFCARLLAHVHCTKPIQAIQTPSTE